MVCIDQLWESYPNVFGLDSLPHPTPYQLPANNMASASMNLVILDLIYSV